MNSGAHNRPVGQNGPKAFSSRAVAWMVVVLVCVLAVPAYMTISTLIATRNQKKDPALQAADESGLPSFARIDNREIGRRGGTRDTGPRPSNGAAASWPVPLGEAPVVTPEMERRIRSYRSALQMDPNQVAIREQLATALTNTNRSAEALQVLREGVRVSPYATELRKSLAATLARNGDTEGAIVEYKHLLQSDPSSTETMFTLARLLKGQGQADEAVDYCNRAMSMNSALRSRCEQLIGR